MRSGRGASGAVGRSVGEEDKQKHHETNDVTSQEEKSSLLGEHIEDKREEMKNEIDNL